MTKQTIDTNNERANYTLELRPFPRHGMSSTVEHYENYTMARDRVHKLFGTDIAVAEYSDRGEFTALGGGGLLATIRPCDPNRPK